MRGWLAALLMLAPSAALAEPAPKRSVLLLGGIQHFLGATADLNFATGRYYGFLLSQLTVSRASTEYEVCNGQLFGPFAVNQAAITPCGVWNWEARTNGIQNNTMAGAVAGTPGTEPNYWTPNTIGLSTQVVATGTLASGMPYISLRLYGTTTGQYANLYFSGTTAIPALYGQTRSMEAWVAVSGAITSNINAWGIAAQVNNSGGSYLGGTNQGTVPYSSVFDGVLRKVSYSYGFTYPTGAYVQPQIFFNMNGASGQAVDVTFTIAIPQDELNPNVPASVASATIASGGSGFSGSGVMQAYVGISGASGPTTPQLTVTSSAGALTGTPTVSGAGSLTALPVSGQKGWFPASGLTATTTNAALWIVSGSGYGANVSGTLTWSGGGCSVNPVLNVTTNSSGQINAITGIATVGTCSTWPASGAVTWTAGGGLSAGTGVNLALYTDATFNLVPTNNAALGYATGPILTSNGAVTRAATTISAPSLAPLVAGKSGSIMVQAQYFAPVGGDASTLFDANDGTFNNRRQMYVNNVNMLQAISNNAGAGTNVQNYSNGGGDWTAAPRRAVMTWSPAGQNIAYDGSAAVSAGASPAATGISNVYIGGNSNVALLPANGVISEIVVWPNAIPNPQQISTAGFH